MKLSTLVNGVDHQLEMSRPESAPCAFTLDGLEGHADIQAVAPGVYSILLGSRCFEAKIEKEENGYTVVVNGRRFEIAVRDPRRLAHSGAGVADTGPQRLTAPMPGKIVRVMVEEGQAVEAGQGLIVVEAMKMQNEIKSPKAGVVKSIAVRQGGSVKPGDVLIVVE